MTAVESAPLLRGTTFPRRASALLHQTTRPASAPLWVLLNTAVLLVRAPGVPAWRAVFGEDGGIFLTDALASPGWGSLLTPYQGYLQLAARLLAEVVADLPLSAAAWLLAGLAALAAALLSLFTYVASGAVLTTRWARLSVAVAPVFLPAGWEIGASATNLHWYLNVACFWAVVAPLRGRRLRVAAVVVVVLAVLSDPLAGLFLPVAAWRAWRALGLPIPGLGSRPAGRVPAGTPRVRGATKGRVRPEMAALAVPAAFVICVSLQLALGAARQRPDHFLPSRASDLPGIYGLRVAGSFLLGDRFLPGLFARLGLPFAFTCLAVVAAGVAYALTVPRSRNLVLLCAAASVVWLVVPLMLRGTATWLDRVDPGLPGSRYVFPPVLLLAVAYIAWLDGVHADAAELSPSPLRAWLPQVCATAAFALIAAGSWSLPSQRTDGPVWSSTLAEARQRCQRADGSPREAGRSAEAPWGRAAATGQVLVPVAPAGPSPRWSVVVDCARLSA